IFCPSPLTITSSTQPPPLCLYTLSLHDALPILLWSSSGRSHIASWKSLKRVRAGWPASSISCTDYLISWNRTHIVNGNILPQVRSEEHTSELQSLRHLVCCLLLEKT